MSELQAFNHLDYESFPIRNNEYEGFVYAVEFGDKIKFGKTQNPKARIKSLLTISRYSDCIIGKVAFSKSHYNFDENENLILKNTPNRFGTTELFDIPFSEALMIIQSINCINLSKEQFDKKIYDAKNTAKALGKIVVGNIVSNDDYNAYLISLLSNIQIDVLELWEFVLSLETRKSAKEELFYKFIKIYENLGELTTLL